MTGLSPVTAATADDPYPYYAQLVAQRPFYFDRDLHLWVASSAWAVESVLGNPSLRVRPVAEPVPNHMEDTNVGEIFAQLVRMNEGDFHQRLRHDLIALTDSFDLRRIHSIDVDCDVDPLYSMMYRLPVLAVVSLLGVNARDPSSVADATETFARAMAPGSTREDVLRAIPAVDALNAQFVSRFPDDEMRANAVGLVFQTHAATAGLVGNTLVHLAAIPRASRDATLHDADKLEEFVTEIARVDSPVANTRRFAAADARIGEAVVHEGESVLVLLAAANHDPAAQGRTYTFGIGRHACIAAGLATAIACSAAVRIADCGIDIASIERQGFEPSLNVRIPKLGLTVHAGRKGT